MLTIEEQVSIMEAQLSAFSSMMDKMQYLSEFFGKDPEFSKEAIHIVPGNLCQTIRW